MDAAAGILILALAVRGLFRGSIAQVFSLIGVVVGLWAAAWVSQWVGQHWQGARPAVIFWALHWLVAGLAGLAVACVFQWWGTRLGEAVRESPVGWLDRVTGMLFGGATGVLVTMALTLLMLLAPWPRGLSAQAARARVSPPLVHGGELACDWGGRFIPGQAWLKRQFILAAARLRG